ncbi:hypothetical protein ANAPRD1_00767 [Anaplasma phagocytophilum]|nr:hypothetical protein ANAPRD1_00767 [Anaplasma phagocytophilum]SCV65781.1 hypothetical protein ANAPH1_00886 [Anaplasma phagocytophilum]SCV65920.1 hypothetical protein ANAPH2_01422 [Anaplasma phagocytophilum]
MISAAFAVYSLGRLALAVLGLPPPLPWICCNAFTMSVAFILLIAASPTPTINVVLLPSVVEIATSFDFISSESFQKLPKSHLGNNKTLLLHLESILLEPIQKLQKQLSEHKTDVSESSHTTHQPHVT